MSSGSYSIAQILLTKATEDEKALESDCLSDSILGFHAQQAVEKLLKALLSARSVPFALTHDLGRLRTLLAAAGESLPETPLALGDLGDFAVVYRYDLLFQYSSPNKNDLIETVRLIREQVTARIAALSETP